MIHGLGNGLQVHVRGIFQQKTHMILLNSKKCSTLAPEFKVLPEFSV